MKVKKIDLNLLFFYSLGFILCVISTDIFPSKYYSDSGFIIGLLSKVSAIDWDFYHSYENTAKIYNLLGFTSLSSYTLAALFTFTINFSIVAFVIVKCYNRSFPLEIIYFIFFPWLMLLVIFTGMYSKELITFTLVGCVIYFSSNLKGLLVSILLIYFYALFFRQYWFVVLIFFIVNIVLIRSQFTLLKYLFIYLLITGCIFYVQNYVSGSYLSDGRYGINIRRMDLNVNTVLYNLLPNTSFLTDLLNTFYGWIRLLVPFPLLTLGQPHYIIFAGFQFVSVVLFVTSVRFIFYKWKMINKKVKSRRYHSDVLRIQVAISLCVSFSFVQAMFEPDYGTFIKHQVILLPAFFMILLYRYSYFTFVGLYKK